MRGQDPAASSARYLVRKNGGLGDRALLEFMGWVLPTIFSKPIRHTRPLTVDFRRYGLNCRPTSLVG
ncbi:hypothetical protein JW992_08630 [candidate division KSB1 bacterium]|nr:hypothetical protein [candidate division KSB1 bacterium]